MSIGLIKHSRVSGLYSKIIIGPISTLKKNHHSTLFQPASDSLHVSFSSLFSFLTICVELAERRIGVFMKPVMNFFYSRDLGSFILLDQDGIFISFDSAPCRK